MLNKLNTDLQGKLIHIFQAISLVEGFKEQLYLLITQIAETNLSNFPNCIKIDEEAKISSEDCSIFKICLVELQIEFQERFTDFENIKRISQIYYNPLNLQISEQPSNLQF